MKKNRGSDFFWQWLTADALLSNGPCELLYAYEVVTATSLDTHLYHGHDIGGEKISTLGITIVTTAGAEVAIPPAEFRPPVPVYCPNGLYIDYGTDVTGVFVMWRELGHGAGG